MGRRWLGGLTERRRLALAHARRAAEVEATEQCRHCRAAEGQPCCEDGCPRPLPHPQRFCDWALRVAHGRRWQPQ